MKKFILCLLMLVLPFTYGSAKRLRYFFSNPAVVNLQTGKKSYSYGTFIIDLDTDYQEITLKIKPNGSSTWRTFKSPIRDIDMGGDGPITVTSYTCSDGASFRFTYNSSKKTTTVVGQSGSTKFNFGKPSKITKF